MNKTVPEIVVILGILLTLSPVPAPAGVNEWTSQGPYGGDIQALAVDPTNPSVLFAAVFEKGIFKSTDGGASWFEVGQEGLQTLDAVALAIDPIDPSIVYAGTRDGVFRTSDGGAFWTSNSRGLSSRQVSDLVLDPKTPSTVYAVAGGVVVRSVDSANTWSPPLVGGTVRTLVLDPDTPSTLYAVDRSGVLKSVDGGMSWNPADDGLPTAHFPPSFTDLAIDPGRPSVLYLATRGEGVFRSTDGASSWTAMNGGVLPSSVSVLAVAAAQPSVVYAGAFPGVYRITEGETAWSAASQGALSVLALRSLAVAPSEPSTVVAGTMERGVFRTTDGGGSWNAVNRGLDALQAWLVKVDPRDPSIVYAGTVGGLFRSVDGGASWLSLTDGIAFPWIFDVVFHPVNPSVLYIGTACCVYKSTDGGASWRSTSEGLSFPPVFALAIHPQNPSVLYAALEGGVFKTVDEGASWARVGVDMIHDFVMDVAVDPEHPSTVYAAVSGVYKSVDGGATWTSSGTDPANAQSLTIDPETPTTLYVSALNQGVFKSVDGGASWSAVNEGLAGQDVNSVAVDPDDGRNVYAATQGGVFRSVDGGTSWTAFESSGLSGQAVRSLALTPGETETLYAATDRGVFDHTRVDLCDLPSSLCLNQRRFLVEVEWRDFQGQTGSARVVPHRSDDSGLLWFFSDNNWEMLVKVLDGCSLTDSFWVFAAATTDVEYTLRVTDTFTGDTSTYFNPLGQSAAAITDTNAFSSCGMSKGKAVPRRAAVRTRTVLAPASTVLKTTSETPAPGACTPEETRLCLQRQRFQIEVEWRDFSGKTGSGHVVPLPAGDSGLLWFFNDTNWEMLIKVLDGCRFNNRFWVFAAATTNVEYTLRVTDTVSGEVRSYLNPLGIAADAITDAEAFDTCGR